MLRPDLITQSDPGELRGEKDKRTFGMLVFVLNYDDLCAASSLMLPPFMNDDATLTLGRAMEPGPAALVDKDLFLLPDVYVSRKHARITRRLGVDWLEDLGSKTGTFVQGEPVLSARALKDMDLLEVGHSLFVYRLVGTRALLQMTSYPRGRVYGPTPTFCPEMLMIAIDLQRSAGMGEPIMLLGETGVGKEIAARFAYANSPRKGGLVAVDCGAIPPNLIEGELFGHRRGAFSGATEERIGYIRSADGGTVFLDEIGNLSLSAQTSLLRVVQERDVIPIGSEKRHKVDVRWVCATNANLFAEDSTFRDDLRMRLAGHVAELPPLRERREDLGALVAHFLSALGMTRVSITKDAARLLFYGALRGNIRELERAVRSAAVLADGGTIETSHLTALLAAKRAREAAAKELPPPTSPKRERPAKEVLEDALEKANGVKIDAAKLLGVHERQLRRWMDAYGMGRAGQG